MENNNFERIDDTPTQTMKTTQQYLDEFEKEFTDLYGLEDPTNTFHDHDDFLIIRDNFKTRISTLLAERNKEILKKCPVVEEMKVENDHLWVKIPIAFDEKEYAILPLSLLNTN